MPKITFILILLFNGLISFSQNIHVDWINNIKVTDNAGSNIVKTDNNKNVIIYGNYTDSIDFNPITPNQDVLYSPLNKTFIAKYDSLGVLLWYKDLFNKDITFQEFLVPDYNGKITIDSNGNIYLLDHFIGDYQLNNTTLLQSPFNSVILLKFNEFGEILFHGTIKNENITSSNNNYLFPKEIQYDHNGNVYVIGKLGTSEDSTKLKLNDQTLLISDSSIFIIKMDTLGTVEWINYLKNNKNNSDVHAVIDNTNNLILAGSYGGYLCYSNNFSIDTIFSKWKNGGIFTNTFPTTDIFLLKIDQNGSRNFYKSIGGNEMDKSMNISVDYSNNINLFGTFSDTIVFNSLDSSTINIANNINKMFHLQLDETGVFQFANTFAYYGFFMVKEVVVDPFNNLFVRGNFTEQNLIENNLIKFDQNGNLLFKSDFGSYISSFCIDENNSFYFTGGYEKSFIYTNEMNDYDSITCSPQSTGIYLLKTNLSEINQLNTQENNHSNFSSMIYPNPFNEEVFIQSAEPIKSLSITNTLGNIIFEKEINSIEYKLTTEDFSSGLYFIHLNCVSHQEDFKLMKK